MNHLEYKINSFFPNLTKRKIASIQRLVLGFMFRAYSASFITDQIRTIINDPKARLIDFRNDILTDGYLMKNVKLWIYFFIENGSAKASAKQFQILEEDLTLKNYVDDETKIYLYRSLALGYTPKTLVKFDRVLGDCCMRLKPYIGKFVNKRMAFIIRSQKVPMSDLASQLYGDGISAVMHYYPRIETTVHVENIIKNQIKKRGVNLIESYATKKRSLLSKESDGSFSSKVVSINTKFGAKEVANVEAEANSDIDLSLTIMRILSEYNGKRRKFLILLMGEYDKEFSEFLEAKGISTPNDLYFDRLRDLDKYIRLALEYLEVPYEAGKKFMTKIQLRLAA